MSADGTTSTKPQSYLNPLVVRGRIAKPQPKGLPIINLGYNELPFGPTPLVTKALHEAMQKVNAYGDAQCDAVRKALANLNGLEADDIICGNGSEELLDVIGRNFARAGDEVLISAYGYIQFEMTTRRQGATLVKAPEVNFTTDVDAILSAITALTKLIFVANPNNPTGTTLPLSELARLAAHVPPQVVLVLDLAYCEFDGFDSAFAVHDLAKGYDNVIVTRTFSKAYGLAGSRIGWVHAPRHMMPGFYAARGMASVNALAQAASLASLVDIDVVRDRVAALVVERGRVSAALAALGISTLPSGTNFLLATIDGADADVIEALVVHLFDDAGLLVARTREGGLEKFLRFSLGTPAQNNLLLESATRFMAAR